MASEAPLLRPGQSPEERLDQLVQLLRDKSFTAHWAQEGDDYVIRVLTCPYRQVAREHNQVCRLDMQIIKKMLNADPVPVTRIADGDEYCTYRVSQPIKLVTNH